MQRQNRFPASRERVTRDTVEVLTNVGSARPAEVPSLVRTAKGAMPPWDRPGVSDQIARLGRDILAAEQLTALLPAESTERATVERNIADLAAELRALLIDVKDRDKRD
jgi:hypothetical protein